MTDLPPDRWDTSTPPTPGTLAEAGVSHVAHRIGDVHTVTLVHMPTSTRSTTQSSDREQAMHASWLALHRTLTDDPMIERTTTHE